VKCNKLKENEHNKWENGERRKLPVHYEGRVEYKRTLGRGFEAGTGNTFYCP
jgi:hypothetical protein